MTNTMQELYGNVISSYSRADAIEDGVLVDLMQDETEPLVKEAGFKYPVAMTATAFEATVGSGELPVCQDLKGRLWDVLYMLVLSIKTGKATGDTVYFKVSVYDGKKHNEVDLYSKCGPGDNAEPVLTIMLVGED